MTESMDTKDFFEEGYDGTRFTTTTTVKKRGENDYICDGKVVQSVGKYTDDGRIAWVDQIIESSAISEDPNRANMIVLNQMYSFLIEHGFNLFDVEEKDV